MTHKKNLLFLLSLGALGEGCDDGSQLPPCDPERLGRECNDVDEEMGTLPPGESTSGGAGRPSGSDGSPTGSNDDSAGPGPGNPGGSSAGCPGGTSAGCPGTTSGCPGTGSGCPATTTGYGYGYETTGSTGSSSSGYDYVAPGEAEPGSEADACLSALGCAPTDLQEESR